MIKTFFMLSVIQNPCTNSKWLSMLMKKYTSSLSHNNYVADEEKNIGEKQRIYTNNKFKYQRKEIIQISSAKEMPPPPCGRWSGIRGRLGHRSSLRSGCRTGATSNSRIGAGRMCFRKTGTTVVRLSQLDG